MESDNRFSLGLLDSTVGAASSSADHNINVVIRVRPIITSQRSSTLTKSSHSVSRQHTEIDADQSTAISFPAAGQIQVEDSIACTPRSFSFNVVFEPEASQEEVFEHSGVKRLIDMALDGFACTVFAYGQTSTGKSYTLTGNIFQTRQERNASSNGSSKRTFKNQKVRPTEKKVDQFLEEDTGMTRDASTTNQVVKNIGIVQLSFAYLFEQIKRRKLRDKTLYVITVSYLEVYNEQVLDLLNPSPRSLNVRWAKDRGFYAENLFKVECEDLGDLEGVLEEGCKNRQVRSHSMNDNSSRSHSVMTITLSSEMPDPEDPQGFIRKEGRLCLVDLAGSEKTKRTNSKGGTFIEANNINRSLLVLGNCIACLADPKRRNGHIPYRDSTLTKLLADSLSGNGMTLMIACISPLKCDSQETISTLRYASRAKRVRMNPVVQMDPRELLILSLKREVRLLRMENNYLRQNFHRAWTSSQSDGDQLRLESKEFDLDQIMPDKIINPDSTQNENSLSENDDSMLKKYMRQNEILRVENVELNLQRNRLVRDHEMVCRENEQLLKKLHALLSRIKGDSRQFSVVSVQHMPSLVSSASSPSLLSLLSEDECKELCRRSALKPDSNNTQNVSLPHKKSAPNLDLPPSDQLQDLSQSLEVEDDDNGMLVLRSHAPNGSGLASGQRRIPNSNSRDLSARVGSNDSAESKSSDQNLHDPASMLDLTIRGKSAVNSSRAQVGIRRRN